VKCARYVSHDIFAFLGYCDKKGEIVSTTEGMCENFKGVDIEKAIQEKGWIHCLTCKMPIYSADELGNHIGHILATDVYADNVASEEAPSAD